MKKNILNAIILILISFNGYCQKFDYSVDTKKGFDTNVTEEFVKYENISEFLETKSKYGSSGIFDTSFHRIGIHIEEVQKSSTSPNLYIVSGASRLKNYGCSFYGEIKIINVQRKPYNWYLNFKNSTRETELENGMLIEILATYYLREPDTLKHSGFFSGLLTIKLRVDKNNNLLNDIGEWEGDGFSNLNYEGTWINYKTKETKICVWGAGRLPKSADWDQGDGWIYVNERYRNNGWETTFPEFWWKDIINDL